MIDKLSIANEMKMFEENRVQNPEDKVYHNGAFLRNKKEKNEFI